MAATAISLWACSFELYDLNKKQPVIYDLRKPLSRKIDGTDYAFNDFHDLFNRFCSSYTRQEHDSINKRVFSIDTNATKLFDTPDYKSLLCKVNAGDYGFASQLYDVEKLKVTHNKTSTEADIKTFYWYVVVPKGEQDKSFFVHKGMMFFVMIGQHGIKTIALNNLREYLSNHYKLKLSTGTIAPTVFVKKLFSSGVLHSLKLVKNRQSLDKSNAWGYGKEQRILTAFSTVNALQDKITSWVATRNDLFEFEKDTYDDVSVVMDIAGRKRSINLFNIDQLSIVEILPSNVLQADGHLDEKLLLDEYDAAANEYLRHLVFQRKVQ